MAKFQDRNWFRQIAQAFIFISIALAQSSCMSVQRASALWRDPVPPTPLYVSVLCDASSLSPCTKANLQEVTNVILPLLAERPGSRLDVWLLGDTLASTRVLGKIENAGPQSSAVNTRRTQQARWTDGARILLDQATRSLPTSSQSPILAGLSKVSLSSALLSAKRVIVLVSDLREESSESGFHFECGDLPGTRMFIRSLHAHGILQSDSLRGTRVVLAYATSSLNGVAGNRCPVSLTRTAQLRSLWGEALRAAGAEVVAASDAPSSADLLGKEQ